MVSKLAATVFALVDVHRSLTGEELQTSRLARYLHTPYCQGILAAQVSTLLGGLSASQYLHVTLPYLLGFGPPRYLA
jgi:hypothetical protein